MTGPQGSTWRHMLDLCYADIIGKERVREVQYEDI